MPEPSGSNTEKNSERPFPIVGIGASAGGLAAFEKFFTHLPAGAEAELAFVLIQHLDPHHKSMLVELIQRYTTAKVVTAEDGVEVAAGHVYVIPPNQDLSISKGKLRLTPPSGSHGLRLPIDFFFRSLAQDQREQAVGVILSGTGTDGTQGVKSIKEVGGLVIVQTPDTAEYDGMPRSALATHQVDYVLEPEEMAEHLLQYSRHVRMPSPILPAMLEDEQAGDILNDIYHLMRLQTGHDFSGYKRSMTVRRIERRLAVHMLNDLSAYLALLQHNPAEVSALFNDLLIGVTSFFRNPEAFEELKAKVIPQMLENCGPRDEVRVWVPGCSTGEEAYSLAILFREALEARRQDVKVQIFATDIDAQAVAKARHGLYLENIALDLTAERLARFFIHEDHLYTIRKSLREMVVFAEHNLIENPPFSRLDLISCRNLLIYMSPRLQKKLIPLFHYALREDGYLFLGSSEGLGAFGDWFTTLSRKWKLYQRKASRAQTALAGDFLEPVATRLAAYPRPPGPGSKPKTGWRELVERYLLTNYTPACVVIDEKSDILYIHGHTGPYLEPAQGEASSNLLRMARPALRLELAGVVRKVALEKTSARLDRLPLKNGSETRNINVIVDPVEKPDNLRGLQIVVFEDAGPASPSLPAPAADNDGAGEPQQALELSPETWAKEEYFQAIIEELESANEEQKSNNEEMQATNEELQSANEELETAREEMRSVNEELNTVNTELNSKLEELSQVSNDMKNLLTATGIATLFLDTHLRILRYTPAATRIINLIPGDVGRPISDIVTSLDYAGLVEDAQAVLDTLGVREVETRTRAGAWYLVRLLPYRTVENVIEGVVVTFNDISEQKQTQSELQNLAHQVQDEREFAESIIATVRQPFVVLNEKLEVTFANRSFYESFQTSPAETIGVSFLTIGQNQWDIPELSKLLKKIKLEDLSIEGFRVEKDFKNIGRRRLILNARKVIRDAGKGHLILLAFDEAGSEAAHSAEPGERKFDPQSEERNGP